MLKMIERYLSLQGIEADALSQHVLLAQYGAEHNLGKYARARLKKGIQEFKNHPSPTNSLALFRLYEIYINYEKDVKIRGDKINYLHQSLEDFYSWHKIRSLCEIANRKKIFDRESHFAEYRPEINKRCEASDSIHVQAYYHLFELMATDDSDYLNLLLPYLQKSIQWLDREYQKEIYTHILNFYIRQLNSGNSDYAKEYIKYVDLLEKEGMLLDHNKIGVSRLQNYIAACIAISEFEKADQFFQKYRNMMDDAPDFDKTAFVHLFEAILKMYTGKLKDCFDHLLKFKHSAVYKKDIYQRINCDKTFIKAEVMSDDEIQALYKAERLKDFLNSKKDRLPAERIEVHLTFLKLLKWILDRKKVDVSAYQKELLIFDYLWLLDLAKRK